MRSSLSLPDFVARWHGSTLSERAAAQSLFIDVCHVLGEQPPAAADPTGAFYTFEKGLTKTGGGARVRRHLEAGLFRGGVQEEARQPIGGLSAAPRLGACGGSVGDLPT
jgi:hypothetical protein